MTAALAGRVEDALAGLPADERTALDRVARRGDDYLRIAGDLGTSREGVADRLVSARLAIWARLHDGDAPARVTPMCAPARRVLAALADSEAVAPSDADRCREHLAECEPCVAARVALREAELACHAWRDTAPPSAADRVTSVPETGTDLPRVTPPRPGPVLAARRRLVAAVVAVVVLLGALALIFGGGDDAVPRPAAPAAGPGSAQGSGKDVVPPPGDRFCPAEEPDCK